MQSGYITYAPKKRLLTTPGVETVEVQRDLPQQQGCSGLLLRLASVMVGLIGPLAMLLFLQRSATLVVSLAAAGGVVVLGGITIYVAWRFSNRERIAYTKYLNELRQKIADSLHVRQQVAYVLHPDPPTLATIVRRSLDGSLPRLWERGPDDTQPADRRDFLVVRVGMAAHMPSGIEVNLPGTLERLNQPGPLERQTQALRDDFHYFAGVVPLTWNLKNAGCVGIVGDPTRRDDFSRALFGQILTFHSPEHVGLAFLGGRAAAERWFWLGWPPHTWRTDSETPMVACDPAHVYNTVLWLDRLITEREEQAKTRTDPKRSGSVKTIVVAVCDPAEVQAAVKAHYAHLQTQPDSAPVAVNFDVALVERGLKHNVVFIYMVDTPRAVPSECRSVLILDSATQAHFEETPDTPFHPDSFSLAECADFATMLAPLVLPSGAQGASAAVLPTSVEFFPYTGWDGGAMTVDRLREQWARNQNVNLKVVLGTGDDGKPLILDIDEAVHGPHGMMIGRTGSGKGELLLNLVTNLALNNHPESLNFLLADFKGGATFNVFGALPHCVGNVTNLSLGTTHDVERFLEALLNELKRREELIARAQVVYGPEIQKIGQYRKIATDLPPMPYLMVIIDEFATMKEIAPMRIRDLMEIGNKGRSAGVFLLLAMQSPQGVIPEKLAANLTYRIALKVNNASDSNEVIGSKAAAETLTGDIRGRGYFRNNATLKMFQGASVMRSTLTRTEKATAATIALMRIDPFWRMVQPPTPATPAHAGANEGRTPDVSVFVRTAQAVLHQYPLSAPVYRPWLPPLPPTLPITQLLPDVFDADGHFTAWPMLPPQGWFRVPLAMVDRIKDQPLVMADLRRNHIQILGVPPNNGRDVALIAVVLGLAATHRPRDMQLIVFDSGFALKSLKALPHDVEYYTSEAVDAFAGLVGLLKGEMRRRQNLFNSVERGVVITDLTDYRAWQQQHEPLADPEQAYVMVIENYNAWKKRLEQADFMAVETLRDIVQNGQRYGVHLIITAARTYDVESDNLWKSFTTIQLEMDAQNLKGMPRDKEMLEAWNNRPGHGFSESARPNRLEEAQAVCMVDGDEDAQMRQANMIVSEIARATTPVPEAALRLAPGAV